jgi:ketosteroid isomerase-like protein
MEVRMKSELVLAPVLALATSLAGSAPSQSTSATPSADRAAIAQVAESENRAFASRDVDGILRVYSADVVMMPPNEPAIHGKDALRRWFARLFGQAAFQAASGTSEALELAGDLAVERMTLHDSAGRTTGKVVHVYRRQSDGAWKITWDVWNADAPPPAPR